jgi:hypothetical protein
LIADVEISTASMLSPTLRRSHRPCAAQATRQHAGDRGRVRREWPHFDCSQPGSCHFAPRLRGIDLVGDPDLGALDPPASEMIATAWGGHNHE